MAACANRARHRPLHHWRYIVLLGHANKPRRSATNTSFSATALSSPPPTATRTAFFLSRIYKNPYLCVPCLTVKGANWQGHIATRPPGLSCCFPPQAFVCPSAIHLLGFFSPFNARWWTHNDTRNDPTRNDTIIPFPAFHGGAW